MPVTSSAREAGATLAALRAGRAASGALDRISEAEIQRQGARRARFAALL